MFDFIGNQLSSNLGKGGDVLEDERPVNPTPHGPQRSRTVTNGQARRLQARRAASQKRKTNRRFRRDWMRNERAFNTLRSQLLVVVGTFDRGTYDFPADLVDNVTRHLGEVYGSVEAAEGHFEALSAERRRSA